MQQLSRELQFERDEDDYRECSKIWGKMQIWEELVESAWQSMKDQPKLQRKPLHPPRENPKQTEDASLNN